MGWRRFVVGGVASAAAAVGFLGARTWYRTWGVDEDESERALPGDDLVPGTTAIDTRVLELDAPPGAVWPWLVQMGYGRAGWYSYDAIDMKGTSARSILPEHQSLEVGDVLPTHPGGGFVVRVLDPDRALVVYMDSAIAEAQAAEAWTGQDGAGATPANLQAAGSFMSGMRDFSASWAFILEPMGDGRTRFIERVRARVGGFAGGPAASLYGSLIGFGVFVMLRRQMLGLRQRVEWSAYRASDREPD
jgi:hypothetical protein